MTGLSDRLAKIRWLLLDVDGVLTDGKIRYDSAGRETKAFDVRDGAGLGLLRDAGIQVALVTARTSEMVNQRAAELGIDEVHQGVADKLAAVRDILARNGATSEEAAYVGDDLVDLSVLLQVGLAISVPNAPEDVRSRVHWVTQRPGGEGAVREVCEAILKAQGRWEEVTDRYFNPEPI